jgi:hypothetical protein
LVAKRQHPAKKQSIKQSLLLDQRRTLSPVAERLSSIGFAKSRSPSVGLVRGNRQRVGASRRGTQEEVDTAAPVNAAHFGLHNRRAMAQRSSQGRI